MKKLAWTLIAMATASMILAGPPQRRSAKSKVLPKLKVVAVVPETAKPFVGTWLLNGTDKNTRFVLVKDGTFRSVGSGYSTKGKWTVEPEGLKLEWTEADGKKLKPGSIKSTIPLDDPVSFHINTYSYRLVK